MIQESCDLEILGRPPSDVPYSSQIRVPRRELTGPWDFPPYRGRGSSRGTIYWD